MSDTRDGLMFDDFSRCESPIEAVLQLAMASASEYGRLEWCNTNDESELRKMASKRQLGCVLVGSQIVMPSAHARADFMFVHGDVALAVECDGQAYHDAANDKVRDHKVAGTRVATMRFSGRRIFQNPLGCLDLALQRAGTMPVPPSVQPLTERQIAGAQRQPMDRGGLSVSARQMASRSGLRSALAPLGPPRDFDELAKYRAECAARLETLKQIGGSAPTPDTELDAAIAAAIKRAEKAYAEADRVFQLHAGKTPT